MKRSRLIKTLRNILGDRALEAIQENSNLNLPLLATAAASRSFVWQLTTDEDANVLREYIRGLESDGFFAFEKEDA